MEFLSGIGADLEESQAVRLVALAELVSRWGARLNLSGHRGPAEILEGLVLDALALRGAVLSRTGSPARRIADLGSGAGFPGLPLAIADPDVEVVLVESRRRRHHFQRAACRELAIANAHPVLGRIESVAPLAADLVVAQAVGPIEEVVKLATPWVAAGGWLVVPSGPAPPQLDPGPGWAISGADRYPAPADSTPRTFWYARRSGETSDSP